MKKMNKKGFTLVETLTVIVILSIIFTIAATSVTKYITQSKKKTIVNTINALVEELTVEINSRKYNFRGDNVIYAVPIECIPLDSGGTNPFGEWHQASDRYWAYVLVQYDKEKYEHTFGFSFKDSAGYGLLPTTIKQLKASGSQINTDLFLSRPKTGMYTLMTSDANWKKSGFKVDANTKLRVLTSTLEGEEGNNKTTCTLVRRGSNYGELQDKINTDYGSFEANTPDYVTDSTNCTFEDCYSDNGGQLEYDQLGGIVLDQDNAVPLLTDENATPISNEISVHLTFKGAFNQIPRAKGYAATIVAVANKQSNNFVAWIGIYNNYLHVYTFTKNSYNGIATDKTVTGFTSIPLKKTSDRWSKYDNKIMNVQVTSKKGGQTKIYINGELARTITSGSANISINQTTIGDLRPYRDLKFTGVLYELEIYNRVISQDEVLANWNHSKSAWGIS